jgi:O-antigen/teichoic acid export membrane protein
MIAIGNICISIPLAKYYEGIGSALGTAIALLLGNGLIMNWYYHKKIGLDMFYFWRNIIMMFPALFLPILYGLVVMFFINLYRIEWFIICGIGYVGLFCLSMWFLGMNRYEKDLISKPILKVFKRIYYKK